MTLPSPDPLLAEVLDALRRAGAHFAQVYQESRATGRVAVASGRRALTEEHHGRDLRVRVHAAGGWGSAGGPWGPPAALLAMGHEALEQAKLAATLSPGGFPFEPRVGTRGIHQAGCPAAAVAELQAHAEALQEGLRAAQPPAGATVDGGAGAQCTLSVHSSELLDTEGAHLLQRTGWSQTLVRCEGPRGWSEVGVDGPVAQRDPLAGWRLDSPPPSLALHVAQAVECLGAEGVPPLPNTGLAAGERVNVLFGPGALARILLGTLVPALRGDRVLGERAREGQGSFLDLWDIDSTLLLPRGTSLVSVAALPGWQRAARWDREGTPVREQRLVEDGVVVGLLGGRSQHVLLHEARLAGYARSRGALGALGLQPHMVELRGPEQDAGAPEIETTVERGLRIEGCRSLHVDDLGMTFTFRGAVAWELRAGRRLRRVEPPLLRAATPVFWLSCVCLGPEGANLGFDGLPQLPRGPVGCRTPEGLFHDLQVAAP